MFYLLCATSAILSPDFKVNNIHCVDKGLHERYCFMQAYPTYNNGFVPLRSDLRVVFGSLVPRTRRERNDNIGLHFIYDISCKQRDIFFRCAAGDVTINVHPSKEWDKPIHWWFYMVDVLLYIILISIFGPIVVVFYYITDIYIDQTPYAKKTSFLSKD